MKTVLSFGMGADSAAILLRWLEDPTSRDFDLADLTVLVSMTGNEFEGTRKLCEDHILPRLRRHGVRLVQVCRADRKGTLKVLDDNREPTTLHLGGDFKLSEEWEQSGTIQPTAGQRLCSIHAKGEVLDAWLLREFGDETFTHVIGFECDEGSRRRKDEVQTRAGQPGKKMPNRVPSYPLFTWNWNRQACLDYIASVTGGARWEKSCCGFCPFAGQNKTGRADLVRRFQAEPERAAEALWLEHIALALHDGMKLYKAKSAREVFEAEGLVEARRLFEAKLAATTEWAVYRVGRAYVARKDGGTNAMRSVEVEARGTRAEVLAALDTFGEVVVDEYGHARVSLRSKPAGEGVEEFLVVAPAVVQAKVNKAFANARLRLLAA